MGVTGQTAAAVAAGLMVELKAKREDKRQNELNEGFAIADQLKISGLILEINGDGVVFSYRFGGVVHVSPLSHQTSSADETRCRQRIERSRQLGWTHGVTTKLDGMWVAILCGSPTTKNGTAVRPTRFCSILTLHCCSAWMSMPFWAVPMWRRWKPWYSVL